MSGQGRGSVTCDPRTGRYRVRVTFRGKRCTFPDTFELEATAYQALDKFWRMLEQPATKPVGSPAHLYVVEIVDHAVKVGITTRLDSRLSYHKSMARSFGFELGRIWATPVHAEAKTNERVLSGGHRQEYLRRDFDDVVEQASTLVYTRTEPRHG